MTKQAAAKEKGLSRAPMRAPLRQDIPTDRAVAYRRDGTPVWRHGAASEDRLHIDPSLIPEGWTWEGKRFTVYNAPDPAYQAALARDGWEPVLAENYPGVFMPIDYKGPVIVDGLMLMERPSVLTEEARAEEKRKADAAITASSALRCHMVSPWAISRKRHGRPMCGSTRNTTCRALSSKSTINY